MELNKINEMCDWERKKAIFLMGIAEELGIDTTGCGEVAVNPNSGYTYLWSENYNFTLYMPINCELVKKDVYALWTNLEDRHEEETSIEGMDLKDIEEWAEETEREYNEELTK